MRDLTAIRLSPKSGGTNLLKPTILLGIAASLLLVFAIACGGAGQAPASDAPAVDQPTSAPASAAQPSAPESTQPSQPAVTAVISTATPEPTNTPSAAQESGVIGGRLSVAVTPPVQELVRGWLGTTTSANAQVRPFADPLVHTDRFDGSLQPGLATSWELTKPDGTQWVFHLREGIEFSGGWGEFTAQDVPHSAALIIGEEAIATDTGLFRGLFGQNEAELRENILVVDNYTVEFNLLRPEASMDFVVSGQQGNLFMYSKAQWDAEGEQGYIDGPAGNGPWEFESRQLGVGGNILYSRVADHWRQSPFWAEFEQINTPEAATRLANLLTGQVQIAEVNRDLHPEAIAGGMEIFESTLPSIQVAFVMGGIYSPLSPFHDPSDPHLDIRVREAINRAINREEINEELFSGFGSPHPVWGFHPSIPGWNPRWSEDFDDKYGFDPDRARELIKESGHEGYPLKIIITQLSGVPEMIPMAEATFTYLQDIGIDVHAEEMEWARFRADFYRPGKTHGTIAPIRGTMRPAEVTVRFYNRSGPEGFQRIVPDPVIDELYVEAITAVSPDVKANALRQIGDLKFDLYAEVPIVWLPSQIGVNPNEVGEFIWPGNINTAITHTEYITTAN
jgi:ABC-type transport system substrate-binding protein